MAYGARLESVLGESPRGFESPILRSRKHSEGPVTCGDAGGGRFDVAVTQTSPNQEPHADGPPGLP